MILNICYCAIYRQYLRKNGQNAEFIERLLCEMFLKRRAACFRV